ncbi:MAG: ribosomal protein S18-alanine N-acetyltransferase [Clostridia bacterium]|nr:ribosomal protein S18-alanine N-acetyltransferase [Clostridia bacterium]
MDKFSIAPYREEMLGDIVSIERESFSTPWSADSLRQAGEMDNSIFLAVTDGQTAVGFGCILLVAGEGELVDIAVSPAYRKLGLGQMLMTGLLTEAGKRKAEQIFLEVRQSNTPARGLYEKNGFRAIGLRKKYYKDPVEDAVLMQCTLDPNAI